MVITPTRYAKQHNIRPQVVYQWIRKQGAPSKHISGKFFVDTHELDVWVNLRTQSKEAEKQAAAIASIPEVLVPEYCDNCEGVRDRSYEIQAIIYDEALIVSACTECHLYMRGQMVPNKGTLKEMVSAIINQG